MLPKNFYSDVREFIEGTKTDLGKNEEAEIQTGNIERLVLEIFEKKETEGSVVCCVQKTAAKPNNGHRDRPLQ